MSDKSIKIETREGNKILVSLVSNRLELTVEESGRSEYHNGFSVVNLTEFELEIFIKCLEEIKYNMVDE